MRLITRPEELRRDEHGRDAKDNVYVGKGNGEYIHLAGPDLSTSSTQSTTVTGGTVNLSPYMKKSVYDADNNGVVDSAANADTLDTYHAASFMLAATYDADADGVVDEAEHAALATDAGDADTVDGSHADEFASVGHAHDADEIAVAATPVNYTAATADAEAHFAGIDAALADVTAAVDFDVILTSRAGDVLISGTGYVMTSR
jgi:hypothetical protein